MRIVLGLVVAAMVSGCLIIEPAPTPRPQVQHNQTDTQYPVNFAAVARRVEPVAERMCRNRAPRSNCDFRIFVDERANLPANAYQRLDDQGRPEIGFTTALIAQAHNDDELAFVLGHEVAHHISGHLTKTRETAIAGAVLGGVLAGLIGGSVSDVDLAQNIGGTIGARSFSKEFELEADQLGTIISYNAGFDPVRGAEFFTRIPDPGDQFLGSHPPNAARIATVQRAMASLR